MRATTTRGVLREYEHETENELYYFRIEYGVASGERMVMYDRDGGGYPGSPPECEILQAECLQIIDETSDRKLSGPESRSVGQWFMDQIEADNRLRERIEAACFEDAADRFGDDDRF